MCLVLNIQKPESVFLIFEARDHRILFSGLPGSALLRVITHCGNGVYRWWSLSSLKFPSSETKDEFYQDAGVFPLAGNLACCVLVSTSKRSNCADPWLHMYPSVTGHRVGDVPEESIENQSLKESSWWEEERGGKLASVHTKHLFTLVEARNQQLGGPGVPGPEPCALHWMAGISLHQHNPIT